MFEVGMCFEAFTSLIWVACLFDDSIDILFSFDSRRFMSRVLVSLIVFLGLSASASFDVVFDQRTMEGAALNVLNTPLQTCSVDPMTGWKRDGSCNTDAHDHGTHVVCAVLTDEFLQYSKSRGNDLMTPRPEFGFPGLEKGSRWCLCVNRWLEAEKAGVAPMVHLEATHIKTLESVQLDVLKAHAAQ